MLLACLLGCLVFLFRSLLLELAVSGSTYTLQISWNRGGSIAEVMRAQAFVSGHRSVGSSVHLE